MILGIPWMDICILRALNFAKLITIYALNA